MQVLHDDFPLRLDLQQFKRQTDELCGVRVGVLAANVFKSRGLVAERCGVEGDAEFFPVLGFVDSFADDFFHETFRVEAVDLASEAVTVFHVRHGQS